MIRTGDAAPYAPKGCTVPCYSDTRARAKKADKEKADLLVSIHTNAGPAAAHGTETFYIGSGANGAKSQDIAQRLFNYQVALGLRPRGAKNEAKSNVMSVNAPATLTEVAFHSNSQLGTGQSQQSDLDEFKLSTLIFRARAAEAITNAIKEYHDNLK
jgi:N-acetylmuramoyl-L-alanine amidase